MRTPPNGGEAGVSGSLAELSVDTDDLFSALANERRREVLLELARADRPTTIDELADRLGTDESRPRTVAELHHVHLPKLDHLGLVEYDAVEHVVRPRQNVQTAVDFL